MNKQAKTKKPEREIVYVPIKYFSIGSGLVLPAIENMVKKGFIKPVKIGKNGEELYDRDVCIKRIQNARKWNGKGYSNEEMIKKLDSAIEHTHKWD